MFRRHSPHHCSQWMSVYAYRCVLHCRMCTSVTGLQGIQTHLHNLQAAHSEHDTHQCCARTRSCLAQTLRSPRQDEQYQDCHSQCASVRHVSQYCSLRDATTIGAQSHLIKATRQRPKLLHHDVIHVHHQTTLFRPWMQCRARKSQSTCCLEPHSDTLVTIERVEGRHRDE